MSHVIYPSSVIQTIDKQKFHFVKYQLSDHVLTITLTREDKKNALHPQMLNELAFLTQYASEMDTVWAIVIQANGSVFCAGVDLKALAGFPDPHESTIPQPDSAFPLNTVFGNVLKPVIVKLTGNVYAGGLFFLTAAQYVVALKGVTMELSEVRRGLFPFQVMHALCQVMPPKQVLNWSITAEPMSVETALENGLVDYIANDESTADNEISRWIGLVKLGSPTAISMGIEAYQKVNPLGDAHQYLADMLQKVIKTEDGTEGLAAFKEKRKPIWKGINRVI